MSITMSPKSSSWRALFCGMLAPRSVVIGLRSNLADCQLAAEIETSQEEAARARERTIGYLV
jgi:hypothetical protein